MKNPGKQTAPPRLALLILSAFSDEPTRSSMLGDMHEEFAERTILSRREANSWVWRQTLSSAPMLFLEISKRYSIRLFAWCALVAAMGAFVNYWDIWFAQKAAWRFAGTLSVDNVTGIRLLYGLLLASGFYAAGRVLNAVFFHARNETRIRSKLFFNFTALLISVPLIHAALHAPDLHVQQFRWALAGLCILALYAGLKPRRLA